MKSAICHIVSFVYVMPSFHTWVRQVPMQFSGSKVVFKAYLWFQMYCYNKNKNSNHQLRKASVALEPNNRATKCVCVNRMGALKSLFNVQLWINFENYFRTYVRTTLLSEVVGRKNFMTELYLLKVESPIIHIFFVLPIPLIEARYFIASPLHESLGQV